jgi:hypothetical protein
MVTLNYIVSSGCDGDITYTLTPLGNDRYMLTVMCTEEYADQMRGCMRQWNGTETGAVEATNPATGQQRTLMCFALDIVAERTMLALVAVHNMFPDTLLAPGRRYYYSPGDATSTPVLSVLTVDPKARHYQVQLDTQVTSRLLSQFALRIRSLASIRQCVRAQGGKMILEFILMPQRDEAETVAKIAKIYNELTAA